MTTPRPEDGISTYVVCDGACEPVNPGGTLAVGYFILYNGKMVSRGGEIVYAATRTNNLAELKAIGRSLERCLDWFNAQEKPPEVVQVISDSKLAVNLLNKKWRTNKEHLKAELKRIRYIQASFPRVLYEWKPRENVEIAHNHAEAALRSAGVRIRKDGRAKTKTAKEA